MNKNILSKVIFTFKTIVILLLLFILFIFCSSLYNKTKSSNNVINPVSISKIKDLKSKSVCEKSKEELFLDLAMNDLYKEYSYKQEALLKKMKSNCLVIRNFCSDDIRLNKDSYSNEYIDATYLLINECFDFER